MIRNKLMKRTFLIGSVLALLLAAGILIGCSGESRHNEAGNAAVAAAAQQAGGESAGEHGPRRGERQRRRRRVRRLR